jgi:folate-binding protein YgfZ
MVVQASPEVEAGYRLVRENVGAVERESWSLVEVKGPDAVDFLQGQVTNDIAALEPGQGCYALLLNPKGRILADMRILMRNSEELWIDGEAVVMGTVASHLSMYRIGRQVAISLMPRSERDTLALIGPQAREAAGLEAPPSEHAFVEGEINGARALAVTTDRGVDLIFDAGDVALIEDAIHEYADDVHPEVAEILRIESGRPRLGIDMDEANLPGELGLEERAVSFTKGCYVGQEPVARMHHRGHPNRHLWGLELSQPAHSGDPVTSSDGSHSEIGRIGSTTVSPSFGPISLAVLRREIDAGTQVLVGDAPARVVPLPFETN